MVIGAQLSPDDYCETVEITSFEETEYMIEGERRYNPSWTLGNQGNSRSSDSRRRNAGRELLSYLRPVREHMENPPSELAFTTSSASQESTMQALRQEATTRRQRRTRSRRPRNRRARRRHRNSSRRNITRQHVMRFHNTMSPEASNEVTVNDTSSIASRRIISGQRMTRFGGSSNIMEPGGDLELSGLPPTQNMERTESQNRRDGSIPRIWNPSFSYIAVSSSSPMFSASSHNENAEIAPVMYETNASLSSLSQPGRESQHARSEISNENEAFRVSLPVDESAFLPPIIPIKQQIDNLPVRTFGKTDAVSYCSVCITRYRKGSKIRILPCFHQYHVRCIDPWLLENSTCPICRTRVIGHMHSENS